MSLQISINTNAKEAAPLRELVAVVEDRREMNKMIANNVGVLTRRHILEQAAPRRHTTATRLGAQVTNYLAIAGQSVETSSGLVGSVIAITRNGEIFARVNGSVTVRARSSKWLTIPADKSAYGKRAGELDGLRVAFFGKGKLALVRGPKYQRQASGRRRTKDEAATYRRQLRDQTKVIYWLRKTVLLPQDRGLLPNDAQYYEAIRLGIEDALEFERQAALGE